MIHRWMPLNKDRVVTWWWNWIVAYCIPGFIYRPWTRRVWVPLTRWLP